MQNDQEIFADNAAPFNTIKLFSTDYNAYVKKHIVDIAAQTVSKESQLSAQSTKSVTIVKQEGCCIYSITMSNDTHTLFVANAEGIITQFQKEDSSLNYYPVRTFKGHNYWINSISLSNSKMILLSASDNYTLRVWDLENGTQIACLNEEGKEHQYSSILSCCWNGEDTLFASGDQFGGVVVWSPPLSIYNTSNQFIPLCKIQAEEDNSLGRCTISGLKFQENGLDLFASYGDSGKIRLWSINEKELLDSKSTNADLPLILQPQLQSKQLNGSIQSFDIRGNKLVVGVDKEILSDSLQCMAKLITYSLMFSEDGKYYLFAQSMYLC